MSEDDVRKLENLFDRLASMRDRNDTFQVDLLKRLDRVDLLLAGISGRLEEPAMAFMVRRAFDAWLAEQLAKHAEARAEWMRRAEVIYREVVDTKTRVARVETDLEPTQTKDRVSRMNDGLQAIFERLGALFDAEASPVVDRVQLTRVGDVLERVSQQLARVERGLAASSGGVLAAGRDRRGHLPMWEEQTNYETGLPESSRHLIPDADAIRGLPLALSTRVVPKELAKAMLCLTGRRPNEWSFEEVEALRGLEERIQVAARRLASRGYLDLTPHDHEDQPIPLRSDGTCPQFSATRAGLAAARERCEGTVWARGPVSILSSMPPEVRLRAPQWALNEWRRTEQ